MTKLLTFIVCAVVLYLIFAFIGVGWNPMEWHWVLRLVAVFVILMLAGKTLED